MEEVRWTVEATEHIERNSLNWAKLRIGEENRVDCRIPLLPIGPFILLPPMMYGYGSEYRFTIFAPGYAAVTVYPTGFYGCGLITEEDGSLARWSTPVLLWMQYSPRYAGDQHSGNFPLGGEKQPDGSFRSRVPFRKVTVRSLSPDGKDENLPPLAPSLWTYSRDNTFVAQLNALSEAIAKGQLDRAGPELRALLFDAVSRQYSVFRDDNATGERHEMAVAVGRLSSAQKAYDMIKAWAADCPGGR